jgi:hypothetical protein
MRPINSLMQLPLGKKRGIVIKLREKSFFLKPIYGDSKVAGMYAPSPPTSVGR